MRLKFKWLLLVVLTVLIIAIQYLLPNDPQAVAVYNSYVFRPFQSFRNIIFGSAPFSVGDFMYLSAGLGIIALLVQWVYFSVKYRTHSKYFGASLLNTGITCSIVYLWFVVGWGGNYYKPSLATYWQFTRNDAQHADSTLIVFDQYLINQLNEYAPHYHTLSFKEVNQRSQDYYRTYTDSRTKLHGLKAKASIFGYLMQNLGIQGYYNPFTGEAQVNRFLPGFMLPFVVCHEMAHQSGIAAEGDANLLAYALGATTDDTAFRYSCYFNIWLYTQHQVFYRDSAVAHKLKAQLNSITLSEIDTLQKIRLRYRGPIGEYSGELYDRYLRLFNQKDGIKSYSNVAVSAWEWEQQKYLPGKLIRIP